MACLSADSVSADMLWTLREQWLLFLRSPISISREQSWPP